MHVLFQGREICNGQEQSKLCVGAETFSERSGCKLKPSLDCHLQCCAPERTWQSSQAAQKLEVNEQRGRLFLLADRLRYYRKAFNVLRMGQSLIGSIHLILQMEMAPEKVATSTYCRRSSHL